MENNTEQKIKDRWYTPSEMLELHPKIANLYTPQDLGYLRRLKVVSGKELRRGCLVSEQDLLKFVAWRFGIENV